MLACACRGSELQTNVPAALGEFTQRDLQFIVRFTEVSDCSSDSLAQGAKPCLQRSRCRFCLHYEDAGCGLQELEGHMFRHLVHALCPSIWGQELVKAGLLLALVGGLSPAVSDALSSAPVRGDIHVLLCGDPGLGKSHLLQVMPALKHGEPHTASA